MVLARRTLRISKLPHNVGTYIRQKETNRLNSQTRFTGTMLTPCMQRSSDSSLIKVVFPDPVGPVNTVSSPRRWPLSILVNKGNRLHDKPVTWSLFKSSSCKLSRSCHKTHRIKWQWKAKNEQQRPVEMTQSSHCEVDKLLRWVALRPSPAIHSDCYYSLSDHLQLV